MKVLLTGASGFIGRNLLPTMIACDPPKTMVAVSRREPLEGAPTTQWIEADFGEGGWTERLPHEDFDAVIHLAQSRHFREFPARAVDIFNVNVKATLELADWAIKRRVKRFIFASTGSVYGAGDGAHHEDDRCAPETMYGASKLSAEMLLKPFSQFMDVLVLRLFCVYGPGQTDAMLPDVIRRFDAGEEITLAGNAGVRFNPIYVDDCSAVIHSLVARTLKGFQIVNVCGNEVVDLRDAVDILEAEGGKKAHVRVTAGAPVQLVGSTRKLEETCGRRPGVPFSEGLARTYRHSPCVRIL